MTCKKCFHEMIFEIRPQVIMLMNKKNQYKKSSFLQEGWWCDVCGEEIISEDFYNNRYLVLKELKKMKWET